MKRLIMCFAGIVMILSMASQCVALDRIRWNGIRGWILENDKTSSEMDETIDIWWERLQTVRVLIQNGVALRHIRYILIEGVATAPEMTQIQKDARDLPFKYRKWDTPSQLWVEKSQLEKDAVDTSEAQNALDRLIADSNIDERHFEKAMFLTLSTRIETCLKSIRVMAANNTAIQTWLTDAGITVSDVKETTIDGYIDEVTARYTNFVNNVQQP